MLCCLVFQHHLQLIYQCNYFFNRHQPVIHFLGPVIFQYILCRFLHSRESTAGQLVSVNDDIYTMLGQLLLCDGIKASASGATQLQAGLNSLKDGTTTLSTGTKNLQSGAGALATGVQQLATGGKQLKKGGATLADGVQQLADGSSQLKDGTSQLKDGGKDLDSGVDELLDGANELKDGMEEFDEEAIQKLVDFAEDDLQDMIDRLKDIRDAGDAYQLYSSGNENTNGNVKFIIETASIGDDE